MSIAILGTKIGMTRLYDDKGVVHAVTVVKAEPNVVIQNKTVEKDGYNAVKIGTIDQKESRLTKQVGGVYKKAGVAPKRIMREFRTPEAPAVNVGESLTVEQFAPGQFVDVIGISKGYGFQGVVGRHKFAGGGAAHGSKTHRRAGAIGQRSTPGRIFKNHRMPGHMGRVQRTVQNLQVFQVRPNDNVILITGNLPGANGDTIVIRNAKKKPVIQDKK